MREPEGLGVLRTVWRAKVRVRQREVHVRELERLWVSHTVRELDRLLAAVTRQVHTVREQEVLVKLLEPLLRTVTRQVHTVLLQRSLLKSPTTKRSGIYRNPRIVPMILSTCQS